MKLNEMDSEISNRKIVCNKQNKEKFSNRFNEAKLNEKRQKKFYASYVTSSTRPENENETKLQQSASFMSFQLRRVVEISAIFYYSHCRTRLKLSCLKKRALMYIFIECTN